MAWSNISALGTIASGAQTSLTPGLPTHAAGQALFLCAGTRDTGAGTPSINAVSGYTQIRQYGPTGGYAILAMFMKKAGASESAPTVNFTGQNVSDTCIAFMFSADGGDVDNLGTIELTGNQASGGTAGQAIDIPALTLPSEDNALVIALGFYLDNAADWAMNEGFTLIDFGSSTAGSDGSMVAAYKIQTTAAAISAWKMTTTQAAAGDSAIICALRVAAATGHPAARRFGRGIIGVEGVRIY